MDNVARFTRSTAVAVLAWCGLIALASSNGGLNLIEMLVYATGAMLGLALLAASLVALARRRPSGISKAVAATALALCVSACGPPRQSLVPRYREMLAQSQDVTLFAVDDEEYPVGLLNDVSWDLARILAKLDSGIGVRGTRVLATDPERARLIEALDASVSDEWVGVQCFYPRHVIVAREGGRAMAAVICFECQYLVVFDAASHATTGLCDVTRIEEEWYRAFAGRGVQMPAPKGAHRRCEEVKLPARGAGP